MLLIFGEDMQGMCTRNGALFQNGTLKEEPQPAPMSGGCKCGEHPQGCLLWQRGGVGSPVCSCWEQLAVWEAFLAVATQNRADLVTCKQELEWSDPVLVCGICECLHAIEIF